MVGNLAEWVADWSTLDASPGAPPQLWPPLFGGDDSFVGGAHQLPRVVLRGGRWDRGSAAGVFAMYAGFDPTGADPGTGFRCGR